MSRISDVLTAFDKALINNGDGTWSMRTTMSGGGTVTGNLLVTGNLTVQGNFNFGDASVDTLTAEGPIIIDVTLAKAFSVRKNGDTGDVFNVNTTDGQGLFADGTSLLPSISFVSDPDTGFYHKAANTLGFVVGGAEIASLDSTWLTLGVREVFSAGQAVVGANYSIGRDNTATNLMYYNVPTGTAHTFGINGVRQAAFDIVGLKIAQGKNIKITNVFDEVTNTENLIFDWSANVARIYTFPTNTGTARTLQLSAFNASAGGGSVILSSSTPYVSLTHSSTSIAGLMVGYSGLNTANSSTTSFFYVNPTVNQSSTAGYNAFLVNVTHTTLGSGTKNLLLLQIASTDVIAISSSGNITQTQIANPSSSIAPVAYTLTGGAHTNGLASTEWNDIKINLAAVKTFNTGAITNQRDIVVNPRTYAAIGASTITNGVTISYNGGPLAGTNVTLTNSTALEFRTWLSNSASSTKQLAIFMPGLAAGVGSTASHVGLIIDAEGSNPVVLGNQTATTTAVASIAIVPITYQSTTLVRTITTLGAIVAYAPVAGTNITVTNGPYALYGIGNSRVDGNFLLGLAAAGTSAVNVLGLSNSATAPSNSADMAQLYSADISAGNATLAIFTETAVAVDAALISTHSHTVFINGTKYKLMLVAA